MMSTFVAEWHTHPVPPLRPSKQPGVAYPRSDHSVQECSIYVSSHGPCCTLDLQSRTPSQLQPDHDISAGLSARFDSVAPLPHTHNLLDEPTASPSTPAMPTLCSSASARTS